ncbi:trypsin-like peptidase domain-containing protein [Streptomyces sp. WAC 05379]|uniref:trypsin-like peptidase domain-containing protein n=1 Tax=Streptomyces sp. WAC 05379 TaxID=2203207 RepID=UPI00163B70EC|nr:trypsin-like peptidase domain-containing protein [Streptomyces sp. WAC 05379]
MIPAALTGWEGLLKAATVRLEPPSGEIGTGFVIAEGLVATCAHVVARDESSLPEQVRGRVVALGQDVVLAPVAESYVRDRDGGLDVVLLRVVDTPGTPARPLRPVLTSGVLEINDTLWTYGHPVRGFVSGQSALLRHLGTDLRSDRAEGPWLPHGEGRLGKGCSGSAVINIRTGAVCGMLSTSDLSSSVHMVPVAEILARCPAGVDREGPRGDWLRRLSADQLRAGGWPTPLLLEYLSRARSWADGQHPYPMIEGDAPETLSLVYVSPFVGPEETSPEDSGSDGSGPGTAAQEPASPVAPVAAENERIPAGELFGLDENILLVGAPGAGKSSLLRHAVTELAAHWKRSPWHDVVPVRVDARDLVRVDTPDVDRAPLLTKIAEAMSKDDTAPLAAGWPPELFDEPPTPTSRWLILVDGLDEMGDPDARKTLLDKITGLSKTEEGTRFRFLVTTRPLPAEELPSGLRRFDLLPLDRRQLSDFAERWLAALGMSEPRDAARRFIDRLEASDMADPARTPLMASMLCQLFKADDDKPLPRGRSAVYQKFVEAAQHDRRWKRRESPWPRLRDRVRADYGDRGVAALTELRDKLPDYIERLAHERHKGTEGSAVELVSAWSRRIDHPGVSDKRWDAMRGDALPELLRASGLLRQRHGDFVFIHQTFAEFLTAQRIAKKVTLSTVEFRRVFHHNPLWPSRVLGHRFPDPAATSVVRFLIDAWAREGQLGLKSALRGLATHGEGAALIATLVADGAMVDRAAQNAAITVLRKAARELDHEAAMALARMGDDHGVDILIDATQRHRSVEHRLKAARGLADVGHPRGLGTLRAMAADTTDPGRLLAAEELVRRDEPEGTAALVEMAASPDTGSTLWLEAARAMMRLQLAQGVEALLTRLTDTGASSQARILAAEHLEGHHAETVARTLAELIRGELTPEDRVRALRLLVSSNGPRVATMLGELAEDAQLPVHLRIEAAQAIKSTKKREQLLLAAAADRCATSELRLVALRQVSVRDSRHIDLLLSIVDDHSTSLANRHAAARLLPPSAEPRARIQSALTALVNDTPDGQYSARVRVELLTATASWWPPETSEGLPSQWASRWWCDTAVALATTGNLGEGNCRHLIVRLGQAHAQTHLHQVAATEELPARLRLEAARLATVGAAGPDTRRGMGLALVRNRSLHLRLRLLALIDVAREVVGGSGRPTDLVRTIGYTVGEAIEKVLSALLAVLTAVLRLPFVALTAVLPFGVAVAANAFTVARAAETPPESWKPWVYAAVTGVLVAALHAGACQASGASRKGSRLILCGLLAGAAVGLLRFPEPAVLNEWGTHLAAVIPWDEDWRFWRHLVHRS